MCIKFTNNNNNIIIVEVHSTQVELRPVFDTPLEIYILEPVSGAFYETNV